MSSTDIFYDEILNSLDDIDVDLDDLWNYEKEDKIEYQDQKSINYERKKSRARIHRLEVNAMYTQLRKLLNAPENKRRSRGKLIALAIDKIQELQAKLIAMEEQLKVFKAAANQAGFFQPNLMYSSYPVYPLVQGPMILERKERKVRKLNEISEKCSNILFQVESCTIFSFLDATSLCRSISVCQRWSKQCRKDIFWKKLCYKRWKSTDFQINDKQSLLSSWKNLHAVHYFPQIPRPGKQYEIELGNARIRGADVWLFLNHRSNSYTNRSAVVNGLLQSIPVIELRIYLQNIGDSSLFLDFSGVQVTSALNEIFDLLNKNNGLNYAPRLRSINETILREDVSPQDVLLSPFDVAGYSIFVRCSNCETEEEFLNRFPTIKIPLVRKSRKNMIQSLAVINLAPFGHMEPSTQIVSSTQILNK